MINPKQTLGKYRVEALLGEGGFAHPVRSHQDDDERLADEVKLHQLRDRGSVALLRPVPVEVGQRFEPTEMGVAQTSLQ